MTSQVAGAFIMPSPRNCDGWMAVICSISTANLSLGLGYVRDASVDINDLALLDGNSRRHLEMLVNWRCPGCHLALCERSVEAVKQKC